MKDSPDRDQVEKARAAATARYAGEVVAHRSCGVAIAETFGCPIRPYVALRRGGLTGEHECGAMRAGEMVLSELLASDDPAAPLPQALEEAIGELRARCRREFGAGSSESLSCNSLTARFADFQSAPRKGFCAGLVGSVASHVADLAEQSGSAIRLVPPEG